VFVTVWVGSLVASYAGSRQLHRPADHCTWHLARPQYRTVLDHGLSAWLAITWWCFFGGEEGAAGLALMPSHQVVAIGEHSYLGVLVPLAPVPFGGAFIYVPANWVEPAEGVSNG
jgi:hypothetical protein